MGYKPEKKIYRIMFPHRSGLEVRMRSTSIGRMQAIMGADVQSISGANDDTTMEHFFSEMDSLLVSWNVIHPELENGEDKCSVCGLQEDDPLPAGGAGLKCIELDLLQDIVQQWGRAITQVSPPKEQSSSDGERSMQEQMLALDAKQNL